MKTLTACTAVLAAMITFTTASADQRVLVQPNPGTGPAASYFLGVYTETVAVTLPGGPVGPVAAAQVGVRVVPSPGPGPVHYVQRVTGVVPGSPAAHIGLEPGDQLVTGNGRPLTCRNALIHAVNQSGGQLNLVVINVRTGQPMNLTAYPRYQGGPVALNR
ncbi:PDZ domain-containing protein [Crateriforma conspicua]|uniref:PDZ domain-containing protein n=1 Tax=Crateriforma conspicua TaxID=2527996 RepID=UPI001189B545|nr:PDZ domain-containing protein [Crateriforma conspicua]QDV65379.1 hypothetical protein Mal65_45500 [Crateriforma conspicua]